MSRFKAAIPVLHVSNSDAAEDFYRRSLGFDLEFSYKQDDNLDDPRYFGITRDGVKIHLTSFSGDGVSGGVANIYVDDIDELHLELKSKDVDVGIGPVDQTWGTCELYVRDPDENSIRFVQSK